MAEQHSSGMDMLCDAAGASSDLLISSMFNLGAVVQQQQQQQQQHPQQQHLQQQQQQEQDQRDRSAASLKRKASLEGGAAARANNNTSASSTSSPTHVCHICKRVYERADHLTRHLRSHENARPYQCSRCPKRFNRADLLTRHESTHDRDANGTGRTFIRRSDRAAEACLNCAASKAKCDDQKPCGRCRAKNLPCNTSAKRPHPFQSSSEGGPPSAPSPSESSGIMISSMPGDPSGGLPDFDNSSGGGGGGGGGGNSMGMANGVEVVQGSGGGGGGGDMDAFRDPSSFLVGDMLHGASAPIMDGIPDDMVYFHPTHNFFQDMEFTAWDLDFDTFTVPQLESSTGISPQSTNTTSSSKPSSSRALAARDPSCGHAAFKRSPWIWEPESQDYVGRAKEGLHLNEAKVAQSPAFDRLKPPTHRHKMGEAMRDRLLAVVLSQNKDPHRVPRLPRLDILNYLLQAHFAQAESQHDSWMHAASFKPDDALPELLAAVIASGAVFISVPEIWKFGLALQEVVRLSIPMLFERNNATTRDLRCLQGEMLVLDIGFWSGFKRKMELAESFTQPLLTMLRRAGVFSAPADSPFLIPLESDSAEVLETKWHKFIRRESYKRLIIHLFFHDIQGSVSLQKNPLISFTELCFSLPAARDLWKAPSATAWRQAFLRKAPLAPDTPLPRVSDIMHSMGVLDEFEEWVDADLCHRALLHGYWGQIAAYREAVKFYQTAVAPRAQRYHNANNHHHHHHHHHQHHHNNNQSTHPHRRRSAAVAPPPQPTMVVTSSSSLSSSAHSLWLKSQHQELYRDLSEFSTVIYVSRRAAPSLAIVAELFMMVLHVSPADLQSFAGKFGEEESRRAAAALADGWAGTPESRYAVWHAGQVLLNARQLPPTSLRAFNAIAVYLASLTLWVYGLLTLPPGGGPQQQQQHDEGLVGLGGAAAAAAAQQQQQQQPPVSVLLDGEETRDTKAFLQLDRGVPGLSVSGDPSRGVESLANPAAILALAADVMRDNFPVKNEPVPPLVQSLVDLLHDLGSAQNISREGSETPL